MRAIPSGTWSNGPGTWSNAGTARSASPTQVEIIMCGRCGITVMLGGGLAAQSDQLLRLPQPVRRWLTDRGWHHYPSTWECGQHSARQVPCHSPRPKGKPAMSDRLTERLQSLAERASGRDQSIRNQCRATSRAGGKSNMYGPGDMYRCKKEARHTGRHEDDYGTQWVTEPRFKRLVERGPR